MSGPKSSRYTLTAEQLKKILEEQERIRKELEEKARKERECVEAIEFLSSVKSKSDKLVSIIKNYEKKLLNKGTTVTNVNPSCSHNRNCSSHRDLKQIAIRYDGRSS